MTLGVLPGTQHTGDDRLVSADTVIFPHHPQHSQVPQSVPFLQARQLLAHQYPTPTPKQPLNSFPVLQDPSTLLGHRRYQRGSKGKGRAGFLLKEEENSLYD